MRALSEVLRAFERVKDESSSNVSQLTRVWERVDSVSLKRNLKCTLMRWSNLPWCSLNWVQSWHPQNWCWAELSSFSFYKFLIFNLTYNSSSLFLNVFLSDSQFWVLTVIKGVISQLSWLCKSSYVIQLYCRATSVSYTPAGITWLIKNWKLKQLTWTRIAIMFKMN